MSQSTTLTEEQQRNFDNRLKELGLNQSHVVAELRTGATPGPTYLSSHPDFESAIPPQILTFNSLDDVKRLGGIPDEQYDNALMEEHYELPPAWPEEKNDLASEELQAEENRNIRQAFIAYVYGHSDRVKSYKNIIEKHFFPMEVAAFAVLDVVVDPDHPLILKGPNQTYNFGTVTIKPGGQIICEADVNMVVQNMVKE